MAQHFIGYYYVRENGRLVIVRKMTLAAEPDEVTALNLAGQRDPRYIELEDAEVGVIIGEQPESYYQMGFQLTAGYSYHKDIDVSGTHFPGRCSGCEGPQVAYTEMLLSGNFRCPHCGNIFMGIRSNPYNDIACGLALQDGKLDDKSVITPPFELPFGFPVPPALIPGSTLTLDRLQLVTEHENLDNGLGLYAEALDK